MRINFVCITVGGPHDVLIAWPRFGFSLRPFHLYARAFGRVFGLAENLELERDESAAVDPALEDAPAVDVECVVCGAHMGAFVPACIECGAEDCCECNGRGRWHRRDGGIWASGDCSTCRGTGSALIEVGVRS